MEWTCRLALGVLMLLGTVQCQGDRYRFVIGVYCKYDLDWEETVRSSLHDIESQNPDLENLMVESRYLYDEFPLDFSGIMSANYTIGSSDISILIGPYNPTLSLISHDRNIPYLVTSLQEMPPDTPEYEYIYHMLPPRKIVHAAVMDLMESYHWEEAAIIYDNQNGIELISEIMVQTKNELTVRSWRLDYNTDNDTLRTYLLNLRLKGIRHICLLCDKDNVARLLRLALKLSMLSYSYSWIVVTLNPYEVDYSSYRLTEVNLTTLKLRYDVTHDDMKVQAQESFFNRLIARKSLETALESAVSFMKTGEWSCLKTLEVGCIHDIKGTEIQPYIYSPYNGSRAVTDITEYNISYQVPHFHITTLSLVPEGLEEVGTWHSYLPAHHRLQMPPINKTKKHNENNPFYKDLLKVVTILDPPFVMYAKDHENKQGNDQFEGFLIDMIRQIEERFKKDGIPFNYEIYEVPDQNFGSKNDSGDWNGMINELIQGNADMCLGSISITSEREEVVDFTKPFMQRSYNLLIKKPREKSSIFQFLWPLSHEVWFLIISSLIVLGVLLYFMDRISPNSNDPSYQFNLRESIWFIYGSLVGAGTEVIPRTISGRLLAGSWWFFSLILISSYTANLAAFLTVTKIEGPIRSLSDLVGQNKIKYGTVANSNAESFFKNSRLDLFKKMWEFIEFTNGLVDNSSVGLDRVKEGEYAFVWDAPVNRYITMQNCDVMTVGEPFDQKGYGIGVPLGASYRDTLTMMILHINEQGVIQELQSKWWSNSKCNMFKETGTGLKKELNFFNVAGVFLVLAIGTLLAIFTAVLEYMFFKRKAKKKQNKNSKEPEASDTELQMTLYRNEDISNGNGPKITRQRSWMFH